MASQAGKKSGKRKEAQARRETQAAAEVRRSAALGQRPRASVGSAVAGRRALPHP